MDIGFPSFLFPWNALFPNGALAIIIKSDLVFVNAQDKAEEQMPHPTSGLFSPLVKQICLFPKEPSSVRYDRCFLNRSVPCQKNCQKNRPLSGKKIRIERNQTWISVKPAPITYTTKTMKSITVKRIWMKMITCVSPPGTLPPAASTAMATNTKLWGIRSDFSA